MVQTESARDNPGTLRDYEATLILKPDTLQEGILALNNRIKEIIETGGGKLIGVENWGKRRLAYEIKKQLKGIYMYYRFLGSSAPVKELERNFRLHEAVVRYLTIVIDNDIDPTARPARSASGKAPGLMTSFMRYTVLPGMGVTAPVGIFLRSFPR